MTGMIFRKDGPGFSFIEVLISLLLTSLYITGFLTVLADSSKHTLNADVLASAESIARTQMEYVKAVAYDGANNPPIYAHAPLPTGQGNWSVVVNAVRLDPKNNGTAADDGLQKIIVTVSFDGAQVLSLEGYKIQQ